MPSVAQVRPERIESTIFGDIVFGRSKTDGRALILGSILSTAKTTQPVGKGGASIHVERGADDMGI